jgi:hypothetical protein
MDRSSSLGNFSVAYHVVTRCPAARPVPARGRLCRGLAGFLWPCAPGALYGLLTASHCRCCLSLAACPRAIKG